MSDSHHDALRAIPSVEWILRSPPVVEMAAGLPQGLVVGIIREILTGIRTEVRAGRGTVDREAILGSVVRALALQAAGRPAWVVNATGVILHTNLGRAVLGERLARRLADTARRYTDLELDIETGERGRREAQVELLIRTATGADAALVVNNCAAAVLLLLDTFARGHEVIVSRGELVEIGGAFRVPDVLARSGATMVEVGTTNKTKPGDYEEAVTPETAVFLKVHTSNFRVLGFTEAASIAELAELAAGRDILVVRDLGSGATGLTDSPVPDDEPTLAGELRAGAHLVAASGDKLLGGPQAGIIVGRADLVARAARNPLYRALRPGKLTYAALSEAVLAHLEGRAAEDLPAVRMLAMTEEAVGEMAGAMADVLQPAVEGVADVAVETDSSQMGGGSLPLMPIPTRVVTVRPRRVPPHRIESRLREAHPPILVRVQDGRVVIDPRTLLPDERELVVTRLIEVLTETRRASDTSVVEGGERS